MNNISKRTFFNKSIRGFNKTIPENSLSSFYKMSLKPFLIHNSKFAFESGLGFKLIHKKTFMHKTG